MRFNSKSAVTLPRLKPRNPVIQALVRGVVNATSGRHVDKRRPARQLAPRELDQIVRECGEW